MTLYLTLQCIRGMNLTAVVLRNHSDILQLCPAAILEYVDGVTSAVGSREPDSKCLSLISFQLFSGFLCCGVSAS